MSCSSPVETNHKKVTTQIIVTHKNVGGVFFHDYACLVVFTREKKNILRKYRGLAIYFWCLKLRNPAFQLLQNINPGTNKSVAELLARARLSQMST